MHIILNRDAFAKAINTVSKAISTRTPNPILTGIKMIMSEEECTFTGSDSDISIQAFIPAMSEDEETLIHAHQTGSIVIPAKYITEIVKKLPEKEVELEVRDNFVTYIRCGNAEFHLNGLDADEYPRLPEIEEDQSFTISSNIIKQLIRQTVFAVSTQASRPILSGVMCTLENNELTLVGTDSHRLAKRNITVQGNEQVAFSNVVVPGRSLQELQRTLDDTDEMLDIVVTRNQLLVKSSTILFFTRLLDGKYPDISRIIPQTHETEIILSRTALLQAIERASLLGKDMKHIVKFTSLDQIKLQITSNTPEIGRVSEEIVINKMDGVELKIAFTAKFVLDALRTIDDDEIRLLFTGSMSAFIIRPVQDTQVLHLVLPVRTY